MSDHFSQGSPKPPGPRKPFDSHRGQKACRHAGKPFSKPGGCTARRVPAGRPKAFADKKAVTADRADQAFGFGAHRIVFLTRANRIRAGPVRPRRASPQVPNNVVEADLVSPRRLPLVAGVGAFAVGNRRENIAAAG